MLATQPQFADRCDKWHEFTSVDWDLLLAEQPQFAEKCKEWPDWLRRNFLYKHPEYFGRCDAEVLGGNEWLELLKIHPEYIDWCYCKHWSGKALHDLLKRFPDFDMNRLDSSSWAALCEVEPAFAERYNKWDEFTGSDWSLLLATQPQFAKKCVWSKLENEDWFSLLEKQPQFLDYFPHLDSLSSHDWLNALCRHPRLESVYNVVRTRNHKDSCNSEMSSQWKEFSGEEWSRLLSFRPQFYKHCNWEALRPEDWDLLLQEHLYFICKCDFFDVSWFDNSNADLAEFLFADCVLSKRKMKLSLSEDDWLQLLSKQILSLITKQCPWEKLSGETWRELLWFDKYANRCEWAGLDGHYIAFILSSHPQLADKSDWKKLNGSDWVELLIFQPQFSKHCNWQALRARDWTKLLREHPQFADKCDKWNQFSADDWQWLQEKQPQLCKQR